MYPCGQRIVTDKLSWERTSLVLNSAPSENFVVSVGEPKRPAYDDSCTDSAGTPAGKTRRTLTRVIPDRQLVTSDVPIKFIVGAHRTDRSSHPVNQLQFMLARLKGIRPTPVYHNLIKAVPVMVKMERDRLSVNRNLFYLYTEPVIVVVAGIVVTIPAILRADRNVATQPKVAVVFRNHLSLV